MDWSVEADPAYVPELPKPGVTRLSQALRASVNHSSIHDPKHNPRCRVPQPLFGARAWDAWASAHPIDVQIAADAYRAALEQSRQQLMADEDEDDDDDDEGTEGQKSKPKVVCRYWLAGRCMAGKDCKWAHSKAAQMPWCKFGSVCQSIGTCPFRHAEDDPTTPACDAYRAGFCAKGPLCRRRHVLRTPDELQALAPKMEVQCRHMVAAMHSAHRRLRDDRDLSADKPDPERRRSEDRRRRPVRRPDRRRGGKRRSKPTQTRRPSR